MKAEEMQKFVNDAINAMQAAVDQEMERKAKLGYKAVVSCSKGRMRPVSAKCLVRKRRAELRKQDGEN